MATAILNTKNIAPDDADNKPASQLHTEGALGSEQLTARAETPPLAASPSSRGSTLRISNSSSPSPGAMRPNVPGVAERGLAVPLLGQGSSTGSGSARDSYLVGAMLDGASAVSGAGNAPCYEVGAGGLTWDYEGSGLTTTTSPSSRPSATARAVGMRGWRSATRLLTAASTTTPIP